MTASKSSTVPPQTCQFCDKKGMPVLPLRYAVARKDMGNAPSLSKPFRVGDKEKEKDQGKSLALPPNLAHYTLRLLRPGYLYVYDEKRTEWTAYVVTDGAYLFQFDLYAKVPATGWARVDFACTRKGDAMIARCITVKDAQNATKVWLGFSDVAWTEEVIKKHGSAAYRKAHMQCLDMTVWRKGGEHPHAADFSMLSKAVSEFALDPAGLQNETAAYVQRYLPVPYKKPRDLLEKKPESQRAYTLMAKAMRDMIPDAVSTITPTANRIAAAAWAFSPQDFYLRSTDAEPMVQWGNKAAAPYRPAMLALEDPSGIANELNGLAIQHIAEFTEEPQRKWAYETALMINGMREAVGAGALKEDIRRDQAFSDMLEGMARAGDGDMGLSYTINRSTQKEEERLKKKYKEIAEQPRDQEAITEDAWKKYSKKYNVAAQQNYLNKIYPKQFEDFCTEKVAPLDVPYVAWLKSQTLQNYMTHNFDSKDLSSGVAYTQVATAILNSSSGRERVRDYLAECLKQDPGKPEMWIVRALVLNQDKLAQAWTEAEADALKKATSANSPLPDIVAVLHDKFKDVIVGGEKRELKGVFAAPVNRYVYQLFGPTIINASESLNGAAAEALSKMGSRAATRMNLLLATVAKADNADNVIVHLSGSLTRKEAVRTLSSLLAKLNNGDEQAYRSSARAMLGKFDDVAGKPYGYRGLVAINKSEAEKLGIVKGNARSNAAGSAVLTSEQFEGAMKSGVGKLGSLEVKAGAAQTLLNVMLLANAFGDMAKEQAQGNHTGAKTFNFAGVLSMLVGGMTETAGQALAATAWGATRTAKQLVFLGIKMETRAGWLAGGGKLLGVVGGVIAGLLMIMDGKKMLDKHPVLGVLTISLGILSLSASFLLLLVSTAATGFIVGIVIAILLGVVAWFTPDALEDWLNECGIFGKHENGNKFNGLAPQVIALEALGKGA